MQVSKNSTLNFPKNKMQVSKEKGDLSTKKDHEQNYTYYFKSRLLVS